MYIIRNVFHTLHAAAAGLHDLWLFDSNLIRTVWYVLSIPHKGQHIRSGLRHQVMACVSTVPKVFNLYIRVIIDTCQFSCQFPPTGIAGVHHEIYFLVYQACEI